MPARFSEDPTGRDPAGWFLRRVGLARTTTFACASGLLLAGTAGARPSVGVAGLTSALLLALGRLCLPDRRHTGRRRPSLLVVIAVVSTGLFAGYLGGGLRVEALMGGQLKEFVGSDVQGELTVTDQVRSNAGWQSAVAVIQDIRIERPEQGTEASIEAGTKAGPGPRSAFELPRYREKVLLELPPIDGGAAVTISQGQILSFTGKVRLPDGLSSSGFDQAGYLRSHGVEVILQADAAGIEVLGRRGGVAGWLDHLRSSALAHLSRGPDPRLDEVLQGVVVGETVGIDRSWSEAFRRSGTAHMFAVSGLHVASLAAIMMGLAALLRAPRGIGFLLAALAALLLVPFVGASPSVVRAAVMIVIVLVGRWLGRGKDQWQVLALAACAVLALNPFAVGDVGFQLSFAAFAGILLLNGPLRRGFRRLPDAVGSGLAVSIAATAGTAPISLLAFDRTSLVSPFANLLVVPVLPAITGLGMASVFLGFLWTGFSTALDFAASVPVVWTVLASRLFAIAPVLEVQDLGRALAAIACCLAALPVALGLWGRTIPAPFGISLPFFSRPSRWIRGKAPRDRRLSRALGISLMIAAAVLGGALYPSLSRGVEAAKALASGTTWPADIEVRILDVGQGNAILVRTPEHHALLFDGGPAGCELASQLRGFRVSKIDLAVVSHPHADHFAGLLEATEELTVDAFVDQTMLLPAQNGTRASDGARPSDGTSASDSRPERTGQYTRGEAQDYLSLRAHLAANGCSYARGVTGSRLEIDGVVVRFFAPASPLRLTQDPEPWPSGPPTGDELNGGSLAAVVSIGSVDILIPGDAEAEVLGSYELPPVEIVLVPHHGSAGAVSPSLLDRLQSQVAVISVGKDNSFGHPDPSVVSLLKQKVGRVLRTDECGWVSFAVAGDRLALTTERSPDDERGQQGG